MVKTKEESQMPNKDKDKKVETEKEEEKEEEKKSLEEELEDQLKKANEEIAKWKNSYYLAYADMKNLRNALEKEQADVRKYRAIGFVEELLPILWSDVLYLIKTETRYQKAITQNTEIIMQNVMHF